MTVPVRASRTKIDGCCRADGEWPVHSRHHWLVCEGDTIVTVNDNFAALIGCSADSVVGAKLEQYFSGTDISRTFFDHPNQSIEGTLVHFDGSRIPVELIQRSIDFGGKPHRAVAVAPEQRTSKAGKPFVMATICGKDGDSSQWWKVLAFSETAQAELMRLTDGAMSAGFPSR
jgi:PAS domain S-box-containing protein